MRRLLVFAMMLLLFAAGVSAITVIQKLDSNRFMVMGSHRGAVILEPGHLALKRGRLLVIDMRDVDTSEEQINLKVIVGEQGSRVLPKTRWITCK